MPTQNAKQCPRVKAAAKLTGKATGPFKVKCFHCLHITNPEFPTLFLMSSPTLEITLIFVLFFKALSNFCY